MKKGPVKKPARLGERLPQALALGARSKLRWRKVSGMLKEHFDIHSQAPAKSYTKFISTFPRIRIGDFKAGFSHAATESHVMLTVSKRAKRTKVSVMGKEISPRSLKVPGSIFKMRFVLTSGIEPHLDLPIDREAPTDVCAITGIQGPGKKYVAPSELVKEIRDELGGPWQNYLLGEMISHSRAQGLGAVALLRPEHNPNLSDEYLKKQGVSAEEAKKTRSQFYSAARKNKMKKVKGSKYFWTFLKP